MAGVAGLLCAIAIVTIDTPAARWIGAHNTWPAVWNGGIELLEYAAGLTPWRLLGMTILLAVALATVLVPRLRPHAPGWFLIAGCNVLGNLVQLVKPLTGRLRPSEWLASGGDSFFRGGIAFPSGHVIWFACLALPIAVAYPRARGPAFAVIAFVMVARVAVNAHWISDALGGLAVAAAATWLCWRVVVRVAPSLTPPPSR
jgi:membrane-associated phospholipid phosphatase